MRLYDLAIDYRVLENLIEANGGEITPETEKVLDAIVNGIEHKADAIAALIREAEAEAAAIRGEERHFASRRKAAERRADSLRWYLQRNLEAAGIDKVKGDRFTVAVQRNSGPQINWASEAPVPDRYTVTHKVVNHDKVMEDYKAGRLPEGFTVIHGTHLRIR